MSDLENPLIGPIPADTMCHCHQVLRVLQMATSWTEECNGDDEVMGYHLILQCVRQALRYEQDNHNERNRRGGAS